MSKGVISKDEDYSQWYNDLVIKADMAEYSPVRGCMIIKPYGYSIWEKMQAVLDKMFKDTGHSNAYFPLLIPKSFFSKEASHVEGFAKECAVVTHYRLKNDGNGNIIVDEDAKLEEELIIRPTSETIIWNTYRGWIQSYRDLPILVNQWANVMRWEMRTRLFLRTSEFLWQEGHTAHATSDEAIAETEQMLGVYAEFAENWMALPVVQGRKTPNERFAGALDTYCIEALMQDGKALQAGTSHFLGQNFAKAFDVKFTNKENKLDYVWATSWGVSTRLIGALIMAHSDDAGLVLPPKLAPIQVVVVPIYKHDEELENITAYVNELSKALKAKDISVKFDKRDTHRPGAKFAEYELKGVPLRVAIGSRDMQNGTVELARRDTKTKETVNQEGLAEHIEKLLEEIQTNIYNKAANFRTENTTEVDTYEDFKRLLDEKPGFLSAHWDGTSETEQKIKDETKATIRCIPLDNKQEEGKCILTGNPSTQRVLFAEHTKPAFFNCIKNIYMKFATKAIHAGQEPDPSTGAVMTPIYQTSTYWQKSPGDHQGFEYSRGTNPTRKALEGCLAALENAKFGLAFSSGMGATDAVMKLLLPGDEVITGNDLYGGSYRMFTKIFANYGIKFHFLDLSDPENIREYINTNTRLIWLETPTNPTMQIVDIAAVAKIGKEKGLLTVVDNTFASPYLQNPIDLGADIVMHSVTKYIGGHSDVVMGALMLNDEDLYKRLWFIYNSCGATPGPMDSFLVLRGIKTLHLRMKAHCENGRVIAEFLKTHPKVDKIYWPGFTDHPNHEVAKKQMRDFGGMISIVLKDADLKETFRIASSFKVFTLAESLGGVESLINHPVTMTHASIPKEAREAVGVVDNLLRLSVGVEDVDDLLDDLKRALA